MTLLEPMRDILRFAFEAPGGQNEVPGPHFWAPWSTLVFSMSTMGTSNPNFVRFYWFGKPEVIIQYENTFGREITLERRCNDVGTKTGDNEYAL